MNGPNAEGTRAQLAHWLACVQSKDPSWTCTRDFLCFVQFLQQVSLELYSARAQPEALMHLARYGATCTRLIHDVVIRWCVPLLHQRVAIAVVRILLVCQTSHGPVELAERARSWARSLWLHAEFSAGHRECTLPAALTQRIDGLCACIETIGFKFVLTPKLCSLVPPIIQCATCKRLTTTLVPLLVAIIESADTDPRYAGAIRTALLWTDADTGYCAFRDALSADQQSMLLAMDARLLQLCLESPATVLKTPVDRLCERYDHIRLFLESERTRIDRKRLRDVHQTGAA
ncbi:hypothetical protein CCYA_CCYA16G4212 [Cyanidiococcus yangmingshanensis]|nr:hypothetical protein CCYA_CCYA16G4212 [Cyanidiococcus yangmingshanensis]